MAGSADVWAARCSASGSDKEDVMRTTLEPIDPDSRSLGGGATPPGPPPDAKRTLTRKNVVRTVGDVVVSAPALLPALVRPKTSHALREKIMLAVSSVNECGYCQWGHAQLASVQGVSLEEINEILEYQSLEAATSAEAAAILFAQGYAEAGGRVDPEAIAIVRTHYSEAEVAEILAYVRAISLGNLMGNTVDALIDRIRSGVRAARERWSPR